MVFDLAVYYCRRRWWAGCAGEALGDKKRISIGNSEMEGIHIVVFYIHFPCPILLYFPCSCSLAYLPPVILCHRCANSWMPPSPARLASTTSLGSL